MAGGSRLPRGVCAQIEDRSTEAILWQGKKIRRGAEPAPFDLPESKTVVGGHGWGGSVRDFLSLLTGEIANPIPLRAGARTVAVCEAALRSIATRLPQRPERF